MARSPRPTKGNTGPRIIDDDGFDVVESIDHNTPIDEYPAWLQESFGGFEWMVRGPEADWAAVAARHPVKPGTPESQRLTPEARARRITWGIRTLRQIIARAPDREAPIVLALQVGLWITDAAWKVKRGKSTRVGIKRRAGSRTAGRKSGAVRRQKSHDPVESLAADIREAHPYDRLHSTRWLANEIGRRLKRKPSTVRTALDALGLR